MELIIGLGGNLGKVRENFFRALSLLNEQRFVELIRMSSLYRTAPIGPDQPDYLNAALLLRISCDPRKLLAECQRIEAELGRNRQEEEPWGARPLDLDLLLARNFVCVGRALMLPHPRLHERAFALISSAEIVPEWRHQFRGESLESLSRRAEILEQRVEHEVDADWQARRLQMEK